MKQEELNQAKEIASLSKKPLRPKGTIGIFLFVFGVCAGFGARGVLDLKLQEDLQAQWWNVVEIQEQLNAKHRAELRRLRRELEKMSKAELVNPNANRAIPSVEPRRFPLGEVSQAVRKVGGLSGIGKSPFNESGVKLFDDGELFLEALSIAESNLGHEIDVETVLTMLAEAQELQDGITGKARVAFDEDVRANLDSLLDSLDSATVGFSAEEKKALYFALRDEGFQSSLISAANLQAALRLRSELQTAKRLEVFESKIAQKRETLKLRLHVE